MSWWILVFYPERWQGLKSTNILPTHVKTQKHILASMNYFDSDMYNSTNMVVYFDGKYGYLYLRLWTISHTIYAATTCAFMTGKSVLLMEHL